MPPAKYTPKQALEKLMKYCAYQERSQLEVQQKLSTWFIYGLEAQQLISELVIEGFLSEERFSQAFAGGKFKVMKWGKVKIEMKLKEKGIHPKLIRKTIDQLDDENYKENLYNLLLKKKNLLSSKCKNEWDLKQKMFKFALQKGYESNLIWEEISKIFILGQNL